MNFEPQKSLHSTVRTFCVLAALLVLHACNPVIAKAAPTDVAKPPFWFNTMVAHWTDYADPDYLKFLEEAKPEVAQVGFYGVTFYSLAHTPFGKGYPAHMPVQGTAECAQWFADLNRQIHQRGPRVVGHFNVTFIFGDPQKKAGFFEWYDKGWDEKALGPKPVADPTEMLQKKLDGSLITTNSYSIGGWPEYHGCLVNPKWRACLKAMMKSAIDRGVDGLIANYYYRRDCMCEYCQASFRDYLTKNYTAVHLKEMGIEDIKTYAFTEIPSWHDPKSTNPYRMAALTWSQIALKEGFDDVFINYGRKLKPDLLVAQWNHLGNFNQINGDERSALPGDLWGRGEDYLWYSTGNAASQTDLAKGDLGDGTLQLRYIRGAFGPKTYVLGKYESTRSRVAIAEGIANGGAGMGFYAPFKNPQGRKNFVDYFAFARRNRDIYQGANLASELLLLYPRSEVHKGDVAPVAIFRALGRRLARDGYAFDVLPDDLLTPAHLARYRAVAYGDEKSLNDVARPALAAFKGPRVTIADPELKDDWTPAGLEGISRREGSQRVVLSLMKDATQKRLIAHLVNYDRTEPPAGASPAGGGPQDEKPIAVENVKVTVQLPSKARVKSVRFSSPDDNMPPTTLKFDRGKDSITFTTPRFLVYGVAVVELR